MAIEKIEFEDKVSTITSSLPAINRIRDIDVNEIKDVVNNNADELTTANTNISENASNIADLQTKTANITRYYTGWGASITFYVPMGHNALVIASTAAAYLLWNPDDQLNNAAIYGSGITFTRDSSDTTKITASRSGSATWTVIVL